MRALLLVVLAGSVPAALVPAGSFPAAARTPAEDPLDLEALLATARRREARGDLALARDAWLAAAPRLPMGPARDAAVGAARAIEDRLALRAELAAYAAAVPGAFSALGLATADEETAVVSGESLPWVEVEI